MFSNKKNLIKNHFMRKKIEKKEINQKKLNENNNLIKKKFID